MVEFAEENEIERVVIGESNNLDGSPNPIAQKINEFKKAIEKHGLESILHPEVYTSLEAERIQGKNEMHDASAAAIILKSYIDSVYNKSQ